MENDVMQAVMLALPTIGLMVVAVVGLVLWLMGKRIARTACTISGLVLGAISGFVLARAMSDQGAMVLPLVIGAAIAGALLAGLLFRVWIALSGAVLLALVAPAAVLVWQGTPLEPVEAAPATTEQTDAADQPTADEAVDLPTAIADVFRKTMEGGLPFAADDEAAQSGADRETDAEAVGEAAGEADMEQVIEAAADAARAWYARQLALVSEWWAELGPGTRGTIYTTAAIGAGVGLVLGLLLPYVAASLESALVGGLLLLLAGRELTALHAPGAAGWFPQSPRMVIVWLGLITVLGFAIQWTVFGRRADR